MTGTWRGLAIAAGLSVLGVASAMLLNTFRSHLVLFFSPSLIVAKEAARDRNFRIAGQVEAAGLKRDGQSLTANFVVTDVVQCVWVSHASMRPELFKQGQGVLAQRKLGPDGVFRAALVLAEQDANYLPPEAAEALAKSRHGQRPATPKPGARS